MFNWEVANSYKELCISLELAFEFNFSASLVWLVRRYFSGNLTVSDTSFLEPRTALNNACQQLFGNNSSKMPRYTHQSRGPQHDIIWTTIIHSGSLHFHVFIIDCLSKIVVDNIEYGRGEGRTRAAASDAAATQALAQLNDEYK